VRGKKAKAGGYIRPYGEKGKGERELTTGESNQMQNPHDEKDPGLRRLWGGKPKGGLDSLGTILLGKNSKSRMKERKKRQNSPYSVMHCEKK